MSHGICPIPACSEPLPDARAYVCAKHYFAVDGALMRKAMRMRFKCERAKSDYQKQAMTEQVRNFEKIIARDVKKATARSLF